MLSKLLKQHKFLSQQRNMSTTKLSKSSNLSQQDIHKINLLIPRLILADNTPTAIRLITTALSLTQQHHNSLSLHILTLSLSTAETPNMTQTMSLLNSLKHNPPTHPHIGYVCELLVKGYLKKGKCKEALKVFSWMVRADSPCRRPSGRVLGVLVNGLCANGDVFDGLRVLREMVDLGFVLGREARERVYRSLLRDSRVREAIELDEGLRLCVAEDEEGRKEGLKRVVELLDSIIKDWTE